MDGTQNDTNDQEYDTLTIWQTKPVNLSPTEFEVLVKRHIEILGERLPNISVEHDQKIPAEDGTYQIDVLVSFEALGGNHTVLIECKRHTAPVKRDVVALLRDKLTALGAQKGMIYSTSGFQRGAVLYAQKHGITLVDVLDGRAVYVVKSYSDYTQLPDWGWPVTSVWTIITPNPDPNTETDTFESMYFDAPRLDEYPFDYYRSDVRQAFGLPQE